MQRFKFLGGLLSMYGLLASAVLGDEPVTHQHFTHVAPIVISDSKTVAVTAALPQWVYFASKQHLADVRVFNADGVAVAHRLTPLMKSFSSQESEVAAIAVPAEVNAQSGDKSATDVQLDAQGNLHIRVEQSASSVKGSTIKQWVFQDKKLPPNVVSAFRFELNPAQSGNFTATVSIEQSEDLRTWQTVVNSQKLTVLAGDQGHLEQLRIAIQPTAARYWRIRSETDDLQRIAKIWLTTPASSKSQTESRTVACQFSIDNKQVFCPLQGVQLPVTAAQFNFDGQAIAFNAQVNSYAATTLPLDNAKKNFPIQSVLATFTQDRPASVNLQGSAIGSVLLKMQNDGQLGLRSPPTLTIQWPAQQLTFLAHGNGPFSLAVGAQALTHAVEQSIDQTLATGTASIGMPVVQANPTALTLTPKKPWLLWGLLTAAVILLGGMAFKLLKEK